MARAGEQLQAIVESAVSVLGYELVGVEYLPQGRHSLLRVFIDHEDGITLEDCERVSHQVSSVLDVEDPIKGQYTLEVSSPGVERPLFTAEHFERFAGQKVKIRLRVPLEGRRKFKGTLHGFRDGSVLIEEEDGTQRSLPLADVDRANLSPEW